MAASSGASFSSCWATTRPDPVAHQPRPEPGLERRAVRRGGVIRVCIALEEALRNAMFHGNLELTSEQREGDAAEYQRLIDERTPRSSPMPAGNWRSPSKSRPRAAASSFATTVRASIPQSCPIRPIPKTWKRSAAAGCS